MHLLAMFLLSLQARCQIGLASASPPSTSSGDTSTVLNVTSPQTLPSCSNEREPISDQINPQHCLILMNRIMRSQWIDEQTVWSTRIRPGLPGHLPMEEGYRSCFISVTVDANIRSRQWGGTFTLRSLTQPIFKVFDTCIMKASKLAPTRFGFSSTEESVGRTYPNPMGIMTLRDPDHNGLVITVNMAGWPYQNNLNSPIPEDSSTIARNGSATPNSIPITPPLPAVNATNGPPVTGACLHLSSIHR